jgi:hypothetical protein
MHTTAHDNPQDASLHDRWLAEQLEDPEFREEFERERREIAVNQSASARESGGS